MLPEIVYNVKKKFGCIFVENHNPESLLLNRGQTLGLVTSCIHDPLTNIQEILHSLQGATMFSSLDACGAYHAVRIEPGS